MTATRRRGSVLEEAIYAALFEQVREVGYAKVSMESVARAAHTGKAALYRRWDGVEDLLRSALLHILPKVDDVPEHGNVRDDLLALLRSYNEVIDVSHGVTIALLKSDAPGICHDTVKTKVIEPLRFRILEALRRGVERGDVRADAANERTAAIGPSMVMYRCVTEGIPVPDEFVVSVVDEVLMPVVEVR